MIVAHGLVVPAMLETPVNEYVIGTLVFVEVAAGVCALFNTMGGLPPIAYVI